MPKGVPANGYRKTKKYLERTGILLTKDMSPTLDLPIGDPADDRKARARIVKNFTALKNKLIRNEFTSITVSGPPGIGKTTMIENVLVRKYPGIKASRGFISALHLYIKLFEHRQKGSPPLILDDVDSIFNVPDALVFLKIACDTTKTRHMEWASKYVAKLAEDGIEPAFDFEGRIIFVTNIDLEKRAKKNIHFEAFIGRTWYADLQLRTLREHLIVLKMAVRDGWPMRVSGLPKHEFDTILKYVEQNIGKLRNVDYRMLMQMAILKRQHPKNWKDRVEFWLHSRR